MHPKRAQLLTLLILLFLLCKITRAAELCTIPKDFTSPSKTDFKTCHDKIQNLTVDERGNSNCFDGPPEENILTLSGCKVLCGDGIQFWEWKDVFNRLSLLILPTIVLIADLGFPPLGWHTYLILPVQAIGNPIGSFRSLLTRFTTHRSYRLQAQSQHIFPRRAGQTSLPRRDLIRSRSLATVFSAYEEFGWQNVAASLDWDAPLNEEQWRIITKASYKLSSTRLTTRVPAIIAIATLVGTLITAIFRTIKQIDPSAARIHNETAHTIAVVCILFITIPQVWFGARIGAFTTDAVGIRVLETMRDELESIGRGETRPRFRFPPLQLAVCAGHRMSTERSGWLPKKVSIFLSRCPLEHSATQIGHHAWSAEPRWRGVSGNFLGINSSWRGCSRRPRDENMQSHSRLRLISFLFAIFGAGLPAYFLSASNNATKTKIGIGCRSLSWITIMGLWITSFALDGIIRGCVCQFSASQAPVLKLRKIFWVSVAKNTVITLMVITLVLLVQFGTYNSCWCRSSFRAIVNLMGYAPSEWERAKLLWCTLPLGGLMINLALILWVELSSKGGTPLCKNEQEMEEVWAQLRDVMGPSVNNDISDREGAGNEGGAWLMEPRGEPKVLYGEQVRLLELQLPVTGNESGPDTADYLLPGIKRNDARV